MAVTEGADVGTNVITVVATDRDIGMNSRISYEIVGGNIDGKFLSSPLSMLLWPLSMLSSHLPILLPRIFLL